MSRVRTDVDAFVGGRIKQRRKALAMIRLRWVRHSA